MISTRSAGLLIDTVVCLTLAKWETVSGRFGGYLKNAAPDGRVNVPRERVLFRPQKQCRESSPWKAIGGLFFGRYSAPCSNFRRALRLSQTRSHWTPSFGNFGAEDGTQDGICARKPIAVR